jgi:hypothetical protein
MRWGKREVALDMVLKLCKCLMIYIIQTFRNVLSLIYLDAGLLA